ncbi:hypothetical protein OA263_01700 [Candidatus Pelagibacter sp.]|nr:hypothetical protein [Candidatus Pelagibacter sp.]
MKKINIIYLLPEMKGASGGAKVIYNHSIKLNNLKKNISSSVIHLKKKFSYRIENSLSKKLNIFHEQDSGWNPNKMMVSRFFSPNKNWFNKELNLKKELSLDKNRDFLIIPEIWSHFPEDLNLKKKGINYAIFIQGFYHMNSTSNFKKLKAAYKNAKFILISSDNNIKYFKEMFPEFKYKILRINFSINNKKLKISKKTNTITYMPRKLSDHSQLLLFYLKNLLPSNWKIIPLENVSENYLIKSLSRSKFFLSFSNLEGLGIPPIEAALSGNKVIGYTGGGGVEYWKEPIFKKIENGDISNFGKRLLYEINNYKKNWIVKTKKNRLKLENQYSAEKEKKTLSLLVNKITKLYNI